MGAIVPEDSGPEACLSFSSCVGLNVLSEVLCTYSQAVWGTGCSSRIVQQRLGHLGATSASKAPLCAWESAARYSPLGITPAVVVNWGCKMNADFRKWNKLLVLLYSFIMPTSWQLGACTTSAPIITAFAPNFARKSKLNHQVWATFLPRLHEVSLPFFPVD